MPSGDAIDNSVQVLAELRDAAGREVAQLRARSAERLQHLRGVCFLPFECGQNPSDLSICAIPRRGEIRRTDGDQDGAIELDHDELRVQSPTANRKRVDAGSQCRARAIPRRFNQDPCILARCEFALQCHSTAETMIFGMADIQHGRQEVVVEEVLVEVVCGREYASHGADSLRRQSMSIEQSSGCGVSSFHETPPTARMRLRAAYVRHVCCGMSPACLTSRAWPPARDDVTATVAPRGSSHGSFLRPRSNLPC